MNKYLPRLFSRRSDGKTQFVDIEIEDNKFRTYSGILDGDKTQEPSIWKVCAGKNIGRANETTPDEQAMAEAKARWMKKKSEKYSETVEVMDEERVYSPMLAKVYEDYEKDLFDEEGNALQTIYSQKKLDGIRCLATKDGLKSRNGKPFVACPHIENALVPFFEVNPDLILDGEFFSKHLNEDFNTIASCVKRSKPTKEDIEEAKQIQYHIYDIPSSDKSFGERSTELKNLFASIPVNNYLVLVATNEIQDLISADELYGQYLDDGFEGQMLRLDKPYENKRSKSLLKRKQFQDCEAIVDKVFEGSGNRGGTAGYVTLLRMDGTVWTGEGGKQTKSNIKGNFALLKGYLENPETIEGKIVTIKYFNLTPAGALRFPCVIRVRDYE